MLNSMFIFCPCGENSQICKTFVRSTKNRSLQGQLNILFAEIFPVCDQTAHHIYYGVNFNHIFIVGTAGLMQSESLTVLSHFERSWADTQDNVRLKCCWSCWPLLYTSSFLCSLQPISFGCSMLNVVPLLIYTQPTSLIFSSPDYCLSETDLCCLSTFNVDQSGLRFT